MRSAIASKSRASVPTSSLRRVNGRPTRVSNPPAPGARPAFLSPLIRGDRRRPSDRDPIDDLVPTFDVDLVEGGARQPKAHEYDADQSDGHRDREKDEDFPEQTHGLLRLRGDEYVPAAADAADQHVGIGVAPELAAQVADVRVEAPIVRQELPAERGA